MRESIDGASFAQAMIHAAASLNLQKQQINELNVFPVPDGDTGTNMSLTLGTAAAELRKRQPHTVGEAAATNASALLRGARGNSGVILSLLFRGFAKAVKDKDSIDGRDLVPYRIHHAVTPIPKRDARRRHGTRPGLGNSDLDRWLRHLPVLRRKYCSTVSKVLRYSLRSTAVLSG